MDSFVSLLKQLLLIGTVLLMTGCSPNDATPIEQRFNLGEAIPRINIQTSLNEQLLSHDRVRSKESYVYATMSVDGRNGYADLDLTRIKIRSRGYSTFSQPKKSYKIKLPAKLSLFNLPAGKNWMLLANFQDGPLMSNMLAMKAGDILKLPFTAVLIPVEITINNQYLGVYWLTPHKEVAEGRIDLGKAGVLLELTHSKHYSSDPYNKHHYLFTTSAFNLPVLVHYPRLHKISEKNLRQAKKRFNEIKDEVEALEQILLGPEFIKSYGEKLNKRSLAQWLMVYQLTYNRSLNQLESIYLHKKLNGKFTFGPIWDFDSAYGGSATQEYFTQGAQADLFDDNQVGARFFQHFLSDPELYNLFQDEWLAFKVSGLVELKKFMNDYIDLLERSGAYKRDFNRWHTDQDAVKNSPRKSLRSYEHDMNKWLDERVLHIDALVSSWGQSLQSDK